MPVTDATTPRGAEDPPLGLAVHREGPVAVVTLSRPHRRNAIDDATLLELERFFAAPPPGVRAVVLTGAGGHFSAGLDLAELTTTDVVAGIAHSRMWHRAMAAVEFGTVPVVSVLRGAVIGGGLELACATHVRVAESTAFYALPEGQRGIFVGGGGSVRLPRLIGTARMVDLMLTGRVYDAAEAHAAGLTQYLVADGEGLPTALSLAERIATAAPLTTFAVLQALPRIAAADPGTGLLLEALMSAVAQGSDEAKDRMRAFLDGRAARVSPRPDGSSGAAT
ncbi:crotonase/enoyl-CoA hydratase family protein [Dactylosporangium vinaceum]|uniref:Crotonase/enoyl-CoA hydratase family protein n=1 Tax=Dactylosporangium vinaceum TaxID=53362 RepID=A0ABV5MSQ1_9ACTN|nr:crotonase/enoyl-CoA hydratase family protein [Dactylosporangium vinaceum]UAC00955.1 crotonase/enoyl-CoA hydratase family protein [Dactylosporangium vinaceum]